MGIFNKFFKKDKQQEKAAGFPTVNGKILIGAEIEAFQFQEEDKLIREGFASNSDVYAVLNKVCKVGANIPFVVKEKQGDEWVLNEDSSLYNLPLNDFDFRYQSMLYLLSTGDVFWQKTTSRFNLITDLKLLPSNLVEIEFFYNGTPKLYKYDQLNNTELQLPLDDVLHTKYFNPTIEGLESFRGLSPLQAGYNSLKANNHRQEAQAHLYENRGATNLISAGSDLNLAPVERDEIQKSTDKILGGAKNFNKSIVSTKSLNVQQLGMSATDLKLMEMKDLDLRDICNLFSVPSTLFNDQAASTLDNLKIGTKMMYTDALIPNNDKLLNDWNKAIVPAYSAFENKELKICQDTSEIEVLQVDQMQKAQKEQIDIANITAIANNENLTPEQKSNLFTQLGYEL